MGQRAIAQARIPPMSHGQRAILGMYRVSTMGLLGCIQGVWSMAHTIAVLLRAAGLSSQCFRVPKPTKPT